MDNSLPMFFGRGWPGDVQERQVANKSIRHTSDQVRACCTERKGHFSEMFKHCAWPTHSGKEKETNHLRVPAHEKSEKHRTHQQATTSWGLANQGVFVNGFESSPKGDPPLFPGPLGLVWGCASFPVFFSVARPGPLRAPPLRSPRSARGRAGRPRLQQRENDVGGYDLLTGID